MRVDTRQRIDRVPKGVVTFGSRRIHAIQTETVFRRLSSCGRSVESACGSVRSVSCQDCLHYLRSIGYSG